MGEIKRGEAGQDCGFVLSASGRISGGRCGVFTEGAVLSGAEHCKERPQQAQEACPRSRMGGRGRWGLGAVPLPTSGSPWKPPEALGFP